jgi:hypothetical protein
MAASARPHAVTTTASLPSHSLSPERAARHPRRVFDEQSVNRSYATGRPVLGRSESDRAVR